MNKTLNYITLICILTSLTSTLEARHIIGGEVNYVCNGNNNYTFTMAVYRDCSSFGAEFDNPATITVFRGNNTPYATIQSNNVIILGAIENIEPDANPCLIIPPNVCVEKATYQFSITLPESPESYHVVYQRCCRNNTISNINNPGDSGATYTIALTPKAQEVCNDSPVFDNFPPIVICAGDPLEFDHSATDSEGDQLVYEFCAPLLGGGLEGTPENPGDPNGCNGVMPNPACPPPYAEVGFSFPTYTALNPMGGNPQVMINASTGLITGTPDVIGQFVVGVCVKEYRNGELLSMTRRDFQFNVAICDPTVNASIEYDDLIGDDLFVINACGESAVTFNNLSVQQQFINEYSWTFDIDGNMETFSEWEPTVVFPGEGLYEGQLVLNPGTDCGDTAFVLVNVFPEVNADFSFVYDECVAGPTDFTDLSVSEAGPNEIVSWFWNFSGQGTSDEQHPPFQFMQPGDLPVSLTVTDTNDCQDTETQIIEYYPAPAIIIIEPSQFEGCIPMEVYFNNLSFPIDSTYDLLWTFGDGTTSTDISPTHVYEEPGIFDISLEITSPIGCFVSESWTNWIIARPSPVADFTFTPQELNSFNPFAEFFDHSTDVVSWFWDFDGDGTSIEQNPSFTFPDTGTQAITLYVTHESGCQDSLTQFIDVVPRVSFFLPNAFTPNNDDLNDGYRGTGIFEGMENFKLMVWNRWGEMIFETTDPNEAWNGRKHNTGKPSPNGVYICIASYTGPRGDNFEVKGFATLIR